MKIVSIKKIYFIDGVFLILIKLYFQALTWGFVTNISMSPNGEELLPGQQDAGFARKNY